MSSKTVRHAVMGLLGSVLLGVCLFGIPWALYGAWDAWNEPIVLYGKSRGEERTVLGLAAEDFCIGAFLGGIAGSIAGVGVAAKRLFH